MKLFARVILPAGLCVAGLIVLGVQGISEDSLNVGIPLISAGLSIRLLLFLRHVGISGDQERTAEADARAYFAEHGHWPDEAGSREGGS